MDGVLTPAVPVGVPAALLSVERQVGLQSAVVQVCASEGVECSFVAALDGRVAGVDPSRIPVSVLEASSRWDVGVPRRVLRSRRSFRSWNMSHDSMSILGRKIKLRNVRTCR